MMSETMVTLRDVARKAGVSHQTVSRVINNSDRVAPETRERVEAAIAELGYHPNMIARSMARGHSNTIACILPNLTDYTFASIMEGAEKVARRSGFYLLTASASDEAIFSDLVKDLTAGWQIGGLMVANPYIDGRFKHIPESLPVVLMGACPRDINACSISLDDEMGGKMAVEHLISLGHRRIAMVTGPMIEECSNDRLGGYLSALSEAGIVFDPALVIEGDWSATSGDQAVARWREQNIDFTALFAQNDRMAIGAMRSLRQAGQRIPEDVSVIGFDDIPLASYFDPPLTTMRQDLEYIGGEAAQLLLDVIIEKDPARQSCQIPAELVVRESTGRCKFL